MNTTSTTSTKAASNHWFEVTSRHRRSGLAILGALVLSASACGADEPSAAADQTLPAPAISTTTTNSTVEVNTSTTAAIAARPTATIDELIGMQGARVHIRCTGRGATTVLLIAGFEAGSDAWANVEPALSERTRVCSYDRPGTGTSDPATDTATFATQAADLHDLLTTINEPGPYVVVGHSFGGAEAVTFASEFAAEVTGLVLVDASPVTWPDAICAIADDGSEAAGMLRDFCVGLSNPSANSEHLDVLAAFAGAADITSLGSLPVVAVTAVDRQFDPGLASREVVRLTDEWDRGQQRWSQLSTAGRVVSVEGAGHYIQLDHPDAVVDEIVRLLR